MEERGLRENIVEESITHKGVSTTQSWSDLWDWPILWLLNILSRMKVNMGEYRGGERKNKSQAFIDFSQADVLIFIPLSSCDSSTWAACFTIFPIRIGIKDLMSPIAISLLHIVVVIEHHLIVPHLLIGLEVVSKWENGPQEQEKQTQCHDSFHIFTFNFINHRPKLKCSVSLL